MFPICFKNNSLKWGCRRELEDGGATRNKLMALCMRMQRDTQVTSSVSQVKSITLVAVQSRRHPEMYYGCNTVYGMGKYGLSYNSAELHANLCAKEQETEIFRRKLREVVKRANTFEGAALTSEQKLTEL
ncbi:hypothetical protein DFH08DRAFT_812893 [Mycena albidolilacea]|uniref:Uncharacterized protein n=1 Tax=Mycena albidolilacea TaxID=1033008 RepID=A0AAD6ZT94_9AGAR|nr:hypothetical protein DFH08DRAFT_812893 [Mycena albidolilacea]